MNILLTCAGRRSYMVKYFKNSLGKEGKVFVANSTIDATSMIVSDGAIIAPALYKDEYIDFIKKISLKHEIKLVVSLFDMELPILAKHRSEIENLGIRVAVSSPEVINICNDKIATASFIHSIREKTLFTTTSLERALNKIELGELIFPLIVKPRFGMGSIAVQQADSSEDLPILFEKVKRDIEKSYLKYCDYPDPAELVIIQEMATGQEYGLDIINDFNGNYVTTFVKRKIAMRSGETDIAETEDHKELKELGKKIGKTLKHIGILDSDVFWDNRNSTILEMNARFGGGYPFSHLAGADVPNAYINWTNGKSNFENCLKIKYGVKGFKELDLLDSKNIKLV